MSNPVVHKRCCKDWHKLGNHMGEVDSRDDSAEHAKVNEMLSLDEEVCRAEGNPLHHPSLLDLDWHNLD